MFDGILKSQYRIVFWYQLVVPKEDRALGIVSSLKHLSIVDRIVNAWYLISIAMWILRTPGDFFSLGAGTD